MNIVKFQDIKLTQKYLAFLYTNNDKIKREIKETIPFTIAMKRITYLGIYLPKETIDLLHVLMQIILNIYIKINK